MASGGGARAWQFLRRNEAYRAAYGARADEAPVLEDAPFALRRQTGSERGLGRFGLHTMLGQVTVGPVARCAER